MNEIALRGMSVYPRACGGTLPYDNVSTSHASDGLSPRLRGNLGSSLGLRASDLRVYPRACGGTKDGLVCQPPGDVTGLSPRLRGNPLTEARDLATASERSIPAPAGEPMMSHTRTPPVCGLSPRLRGNRHQQEAQKRCLGLSP